MQEHCRKNILLNNNSTSISYKINMGKSELYHWLVVFMHWIVLSLFMRVGLWRKLSNEEIDTFELWCWRRLLRVPWTARRPNQSILKEISPGISLEGMMLKLKLQYFGHLMRRVDSLEETLMLGGIGGRRRKGRQRMRWLMASPTRWRWVWVNSGSWWWTGRPGVLQFMGSQSQTWLSGWTDWLTDALSHLFLTTNEVSTSIFTLHIWGPWHKV